MGTKDGEGKKPPPPAKKDAARPVAPRPALRGTKDSAFDAPGRSYAELMRVAGPVTGSTSNPFAEPERTATRPGTSQVSLPPVPPRQLTKDALTTIPEKKPNAIARQLQHSAFDEVEHTEIDMMLGKVRRVELDDDEEATASNEFYDGLTPAEGTDSTETWKAVNAPVQSRQRRRSARVLWSLLDQFAVAHNPRYEAPAGERAHVFVWDVSRAMECEVPHFRAGREMTAIQTVDWMRVEGSTRGWRRTNAQAAMEAADRGELVLAFARDIKQRLVAIVRPGGAGDDGLPRVATAGPKRNNEASVRVAIGNSVEYFVHL